MHRAGKFVARVERNIEYFRVGFAVNWALAVEGIALVQVRNAVTELENGALRCIAVGFAATEMLSADGARATT